MLVDLMVRVDDEQPEAGKKYLCRHAFTEQKRVYVTPSRVEKLSGLVWDMDKGVVIDMPQIEKTKAYVAEQMNILWEDVYREMNPTPYKVALSQNLYDFLHNLWQSEAPTQELR